MSILATIERDLGGTLIEDLQLYQCALSDMGIVANDLPAARIRAIRAARRQVALDIDALFEDEALADPAGAEAIATATERICNTAFMRELHFRVWLGFPTLARLADEDALIRQRAESAERATGPALFRDLTILAFYRSPHEMPLVTADQLQSLHEAARAFYLRHLVSRPLLCMEADERIYETRAPALVNWLADILEDPARMALRAPVLQAAQSINLGEYYVAELAPIPILKARKRLVGVLCRLDPSQRSIPAYVPPTRKPGERRRIRVGFLARTLRKYPDSESLYALFRDFDLQRFEIYGYTIDHVDRVVKDDRDFDEAFDRVLSRRSLLRYAQGADRIVRKLREDDLDIFILANATHFGVAEADLLLTHRVAPIQISSNTVNPLPTSLGAFDHFLTSGDDERISDLPYDPVMEPPVALNPVPICYPFGVGKDTRPVVSRALLGIGDDEVIFYNGSSLDRLREGCLRAYMRAVRQVPNGRLVLGPFNSGWSGNLHALFFRERLRRVAEAEGFPLDRLTVLNEMTLAEARTMLSLCDVFLTAWPHGGATTVTIALDMHKPVVARRRQSSRSIDQFLVGSVGLQDLIAQDDDDFVRIAVELGLSADRRKDVEQRLAAWPGKMPFFDVDSYSKSFEALLQQLVDRHAAG
jgi:predicted O-linked N-acetylglucosamine transferase (SPINDLY family)